MDLISLSVAPVLPLTLQCSDGCQKATLKLFSGRKLPYEDLPRNGNFFTHSIDVVLGDLERGHFL